MRLIEKIKAQALGLKNPKVVMLRPDSLAMLREEYSELTGIDYILEDNLIEFEGLIVCVTENEKAGEFQIFETGI